MTDKGEKVKTEKAKCGKVTDKKVKNECLDDAKIKHVVTIHEAAARGLDKDLEAIIKNCSRLDTVDDVDFSQDTPLHLAVRNKQDNCVSLLLENRASILKRDSAGKTPIDYGVEQGNIATVVKLLRQLKHNGLCPRKEVRDYEKLIANYSVAAIAIELKDIRCLELLEERNVPLNTTVCGISLLHLAIVHRFHDAVPLLLKNGASCNTWSLVGRFFQTPLHLAVLSGQPTIVAMLLPHCNIDGRDTNGVLDKVINLASDEGTALHIAAKNNNANITSLLVKYSADINSMKGGKIKETPLHSAASHDSMKAFIYLLENDANVRVKDQSFRSAIDLYCQFYPHAVKEKLYSAAYAFENPSVCIALLKYAIQSPNSGETEIMEYKEKMIANLLQSLTSDNNIARLFSTDYSKLFGAVLTFICHSDESENVRKKIMNHWKETDFNPTAAMSHTFGRGIIAALLCQLDIDFDFLELLLKFPSIVSHKLPDGRTEGQEGIHAAIRVESEIPLVMIVQNKDIKPAGELGWLVKNKMDNDISVILIDYGAPLEETFTINDLTPLQGAVIAKNYQIVRYLIKKGANVNVVAKYGFTPLHDAVWTRDIPILARIIKAGCNLDAQLSADLDELSGELGGSTALHLATRADRIQIVRVLLCAGARVDICDAYGRTALFYAETRGSGLMMAYLLSAGADYKTLINRPFSMSDDFVFDKMSLLNIRAVLVGCQYTPNSSQFSSSDDSDSEYHRETENLPRRGNHYDMWLSDDSNDETEDRSLRKKPDNCKKIQIKDDSEGTFPSLSTLSAYVIRRNLQPNAWAGMAKLELSRVLTRQITAGLDDKQLQKKLETRYPHRDNPLEPSDRLDLHTGFCNDDIIVRNLVHSMDNLDYNDDDLGDDFDPNDMFDGDDWDDEEDYDDEAFGVGGDWHFRGCVDDSDYDEDDEFIY